jgi:hypothetical protein
MIAYCNHGIPPNAIPFWGNFFMALLMPRILILIYIGTDMGVSNPWFIVHAIVAGLSYFKVASSAKGSLTRKVLSILFPIEITLNNLPNSVSLTTSPKKRAPVKKIKPVQLVVPVKPPKDLKF